MLIKPPVRTVDNWGQGYYGAPRGSRKHKGIDFACLPDSEVLAERAGMVTKIGFPYDDDDDHDGKPDFTYVEIGDVENNKARYFYVKPSVSPGDIVRSGQVIGVIQSLENKYPGITPHLHFEVKDGDGKFFDPSEYLE